MRTEEWESILAVFRVLVLPIIDQLLLSYNAAHFLLREVSF